jgi:hypothetical protein
MAAVGDRWITSPRVSGLGELTVPPSGYGGVTQDHPAYIPRRHQFASSSRLFPLVFSGLLFPLSVLREPLQSVAQALPLTPVVELMRLGLTGTAAGGHHLGLAASFGAAAGPVLVLAAWIAAGGWAARRWFRWEPRR